MAMFRRHSFDRACHLHGIGTHALLLMTGGIATRHGLVVRPRQASRCNAAVYIPTPRKSGYGYTLAGSIVTVLIRAKLRFHGLRGSNPSGSYHPLRSGLIELFFFGPLSHVRYLSGRSCEIMRT